MSEEASKLPKDIAAEEGKVNVQINGTWHRFPRGHADCRRLPFRRRSHPVLLLPPQVGRRRLLPHVHGGTGDAAPAGSGPDSLL